MIWIFVYEPYKNDSFLLADSMGKTLILSYTKAIKEECRMKHILNNIRIIFCILVLGYTEKEFGM